MQKSASLRKGRGDIRHNRRDIIAGSCYEDRIQDNVVLADYDIKDVYHILFDEVVEDYNATQKRSDRKIKDYYSKINNDKKTNPFHEVIVQVGSMDDRLDRDEYISIYSKWLDRFEKENDKMKVFGAFMHFDEKGAPHMHVDYIPIATYNKGMALRVSNDKAVKQMGYKSWLDWKDKQVENLKETMLEHGIEKKSMGNEERYLNPNAFKQLQRFKEQAELEIRETVQQELDHSQSPLEVKNVPFLGEVVKKSDVDEREKQLQNEISSQKAQISVLRNELDEAYSNLNKFKNKRYVQKNKALEEENMELKIEMKDFDAKVRDKVEYWTDSYVRAFDRERDKNVVLKKEIQDLKEKYSDYDQIKDENTRLKRMLAKVEHLKDKAEQLMERILGVPGEFLTDLMNRIDLIETKAEEQFPVDENDMTINGRKKRAMKHRALDNSWKQLVNITKDEVAEHQEEVKLKNQRNREVFHGMER